MRNQKIYQKLKNNNSNQKNKKVEFIYFLIFLLGFILVHFVIKLSEPNLEVDPGKVTVTRDLFVLLVMNFKLIKIVFFGGLLISLFSVMIFLFRKKGFFNPNFSKRQDKNYGQKVPSEIKKWNWGAAGLSWIWGVYYNVWSSLLILVPLVNIFWWLILGLKGNGWAWQKNQWESIEDFEANQKKWKLWGIIFFIPYILIIILQIILLLFILLPNFIF